MYWYTTSRSLPFSNFSFLSANFHLPCGTARHSRQQTVWTQHQWPTKKRGLRIWHRGPCDLTEATDSGPPELLSDISTTSTARLLSCKHSRLHRAERLISKRDLQAALRYGLDTRVASVNQRACYGGSTLSDVVFIVDKSLTKEVTCWAVPGAGLDVAKTFATVETESAHQAARTLLQKTCSWTSHTVVIVDQSGSMRVWPLHAQ